MAGVFISYRHEDTGPHARAIGGALTSEFGREQVFIDERLRGGVNFVTSIEEGLQLCAVAIVVIGPNWLTDASGRRRLDDPHDYVRYEVRSALELRCAAVRAGW